MSMRQNERRSQLFTLRVWPEEIGEGRVEWRGRLQRVVGGEGVYFHDWEAMMAFLLKTLDVGETRDESEATDNARQSQDK